MSDKYPSGKPSKHATVRIPKEMAEAVGDFIKTDLAKRMGYLYKVDVVTAATRELLMKYGFYPTRQRLGGPEEEVKPSN